MEDQALYITYRVPVKGLRQKIKEARLAQKKRVAPLAAEAGINKASWYGIESGAITSITSTTLKSVERALGVNLEVEACCGKGKTPH
ncbi:helix-turn-helix transcriptional regulator [Moorena sp. SIO3I8]|uniref:helix-turn-helix domain-containing protein n=1 Tax=Moorena sp. SIO3I8 TaxID=2607833 RepID=UPI0013C0EB83|nr:helix-turn-helix transcriptional regulator [Moorena sp. SIO3I8]NEO08436.1 helix-turn-helix transcriptional regulator [Moorena sp. SIO3I8]